jgi:hypothetical protein
MEPDEADPSIEGVQTGYDRRRGGGGRSEVLRRAPRGEYIREFVPGEFGAAELPKIPPGFRYATHVAVTLRVSGQPVGRYRRLMTICESKELRRWQR